MYYAELRNNNNNAFWWDHQSLSLWQCHTLSPLSNSLSLSKTVERATTSRRQNHLCVPWCRGTLISEEMFFLSRPPLLHSAKWPFPLARHSERWPTSSGVNEFAVLQFIQSIIFAKNVPMPVYQTEWNKALRGRAGKPCLLLLLTPDERQTQIDQIFYWPECHFI